MNWKANFSVGTLCQYTKLSVWKNQLRPWIMGIDVYIGDARLPGVLHDVGVTKAKALYSLVDSDFGNLEIGLNARAFDPTLRLVLRIYDDSMSKMIRENLDIQLTYSMRMTLSSA